MIEKARTKERDRPATDDSTMAEKMKGSGSNSRKEMSDGLTNRDREREDAGGMLIHTSSGKKGLPSSSTSSFASSSASTQSTPHADRFQEFLQEKFAHLARDFGSRAVISLDRVKLFELFVKLADQYYPPTVKYFDSETLKRTKGKYMEKVFIEMQPSKLYSYGMFAFMLTLMFRQVLLHLLRLFSILFHDCRSYR
jgi:hypothetical protein